MSREGGVVLVVVFGKSRRDGALEALYPRLWRRIVFPPCWLAWDIQLPCHLFCFCDFLRRSNVAVTLETCLSFFRSGPFFLFRHVSSVFVFDCLPNNYFTRYIYVHGNPGVLGENMPGLVSSV